MESPEDDASRDSRNADWSEDLIDDDDEVPKRENWGPILESMGEMIHKALEKSPRSDAVSPATFQTYWAGHFTKFCQEIAANPEIPEHLTTPPVKRFSVSLFEGPSENNICPCPCTLPNPRPQITLRDDAGITKTQLIEAVGRYLYGSSILPTIYSPRHDEPEEVDCESSGRTGVVVWDWDWMSVGGRMYSHWCEDEGLEEGKIWLYCCAREFVEENQLNAEKKRVRMEKERQDRKKAVEEMRRAKKEQKSQDSKNIESSDAEV